MKTSFAVIFLVASMVSGCDLFNKKQKPVSGDMPGELPPSVAPKTYSISGQAKLPFNSQIDADTADKTTARGDNNSVKSAQDLRNPTIVGGFSNSVGDEFDYYKVVMTKGQRIDLSIAEDGADNDLDLILADANGNAVATSMSSTNVESVLVPQNTGTSGATFTVIVQAFEGKSNYVLSIRQAQAQSAFANNQQPLSTDSSMIAREMLVKIDPAKLEKTRQKLMQLGLQPGAVISDNIQTWKMPLTTQNSNVMLRLGVKPESLLMKFADQALKLKHETLLAMKQVARIDGVLLVEPNFIIQSYVVPNDPFYQDQWHYRIINLPQAWDVTQGTSNVLVAVADTGVLLGHPDFSGQFDPADPDGFDFVSNPASAGDGDGRDGRAEDADNTVGSLSHGTHVAGTIAAATNNGVGVSGVGWRSKIMPLRVLGVGGSGSSADILSSVRYAAGFDVGGAKAPKAAQIINLSLGCNDCFSEIAADIYKEAISSGLIVIAASGNDGENGNPISYPASYDGVISVASVGPSRQRAPYSNFNRFVDVAAPGGDLSNFTPRDGGILSLASQTTGSGRIVSYSYLQGTSMAAPHVSGVAALMKSVLPSMSPVQFSQFLTSGSITNASSRDDQLGYGLIDASKAAYSAARIANGGAIAERPFIAVQPEQHDFSNIQNLIFFEAVNAGSGNATVTSVTDDVPWLTSRLGNADSSKTIVQATVDRNGLANGVYSGIITITADSNTIKVPVQMSVGPITSDTNAGVHYFLLINRESGKTIEAKRVLSINGSGYSVNYDNVPTGSYSLIGGTDSDEDGFICDAGEACAIYSTPDSPSPIQVVDKNVSNLVFSTGFDFSVVTRSSINSTSGVVKSPIKYNSSIPKSGFKIGTYEVE